MSLGQVLAHGIEELGVPVDGEAQARLLAYLALLHKWNRVYNLTAVHEAEQMVSHHLLDSLAILPHLASCRTVIDVGSGGGLPGIPLAIARGELAVTLLDSSHKKAAFLRQTRLELGLANVEVVCERVEVWRPEQRFDAVLSRAFADLGEFAALAGHLCAPEGVLLAMKGVYPYEELEKLPTGFRVEKVISLTVPTLAAQRHLVVLKAA